MAVFAWVLAGIMLVMTGILLVKVYWMRKAAREMKEALEDRISQDTNVLMDLSCRDPYMCELAESLNVQLRKLRSERQRYQQGDLKLKDAVTNISHDLRTPLTAVCGYLDLLEGEEKSEAAERYLEVIRNRTEVLKSLINELFRYTAASSAMEEKEFETVVLNRVLEESISAYYAVLMQASITPQITMTEKKIRRRLDPNALARIFENIISNAVKYGDGDLTICLEESGEITFSNSALRLDEIQAGKLFERFYTVESAGKSTGVGLSIAKTLTEQMNGVITSGYTNGRLNISIVFPEMAQKDEKREMLYCEYGIKKV